MRVLKVKVRDCPRACFRPFLPLHMLRHSPVTGVDWMNGGGGGMEDGAFGGFGDFGGFVDEEEPVVEEDSKKGKGKAKGGEDFGGGGKNKQQQQQQQQDKKGKKGKGKQQETATSGWGQDAGPAMGAGWDNVNITDAYGSATGVGGGWDNAPSAAAAPWG